MNRKVEQTIRENRMFSPEDRLLVALSGGADSVALLHFLYARRESYGIGLGALHLNHCLRGEESDRDEAFCRSLCHSMGVELTVLRRDIAALSRGNGQSEEECGRTERYLFFAGEASRQNARIATAHTRSDNIETLLLNLVRGGGLGGLCGIPTVRGNILRPLINCTRAEVEAYCLENSLDFCRDSTNYSPEGTRTRLRLRVVPELLRLNPSLEQTLAGSIEGWREELDCLQSAAVQALDKLRLPGQNCWNRSGFLDLHPAVRRHALLALLAGERLAQSRRRVLLLDDLVRRGSGGAQLSPGRFFSCDSQSFGFFTPGLSQPFFEKRILPEQIRKKQVIFPFLGKKMILFRLEFEEIEKFHKNDQNLLKNILDYDRIKKIVIIRQKKPGDIFSPAGRGCTKTLKKLFCEQGVPALQRGQRVVLADTQGLLWVEGVGPAQRAAVGPDTRRVLVITAREDQKCRRISKMCCLPRKRYKKKWPNSGRRSAAITPEKI